MADENGGKSEDTIWASGIVSFESQLPFVHIDWGEKKAQFTPDEARAFALTVFEAADSAESDAFLVHWLKDKVHISEPSDYAGMLNEFRQYRESLRAKGESDGS